MFARHGWLSSTILYAALLLFPILLYIFFYQSSRIDEATVRNFRSLGTAAERIRDTLSTFRRISPNYSLGIDKALLKDISNLSSTSNQLWENDTIDKIDKLSEVVDTVRNQSALDLHTKPLQRPSRSYLAIPDIARLKTQLEQCEPGVRVTKDRLLSHDCRRLRERERRVYDWLKESDSHETIKILDQFGIEVSWATENAFDKPTRHLSMFFDNYFIADDEGDIIFASQPRPSPPDTHGSHRAGMSFASLASIKDLLNDNPPAPLAILGSTREPNVRSNTKPSATGHSTVRHVHVDDIDLSVFIHPFIAGSSTWHIIGVVPRSSLAKEAIRLRLGLTVDATLVIAILLTLLPILRFWTGGDRSILRRFNIYSIGASALGASALCTLLLSSVISKSIDSKTLDGHLESIGKAIVKKFSQEFAVVEGRLEEDRTAMELLLPRIEPSTSAENYIFCPHFHLTPHPFRLSLPPDFNPHWPTRKPIWWPTLSFLTDNKGMSLICMPYRKEEPLKLDLEFRKYVKNAETDKPGLYIIDSIVRARPQTVASHAYKAHDGRRVAVTIPKLLSIDDTVLPPPFQYAVIDKDGETIFHSDENRVNISNFIDDTGGDSAVHAALSYRRGQKLDTHYDGVPIRAYIRELHDALDWTLVVFRDHSLVDRVSSMAVSLSILSWLTITLLIFIFVALFIPVPRPRAKQLLPAVILSSTSRELGVLSAVWSILGLVILFVFKGYEWTLGLLWPMAISIAILFNAWRHLESDERNDKSVSRCSGLWVKVFVLTSAVFSFSIVPMLSWHAYFRTELSVGLAAYLRVETKDLVENKKEDFNQDSKGLLHLVGTDNEKNKKRLLQPYLEDSIVGFTDKRKKELVYSLLPRCRQASGNANTGCRSLRRLEESGPGRLWPWLLGKGQHFLVHSSITHGVVWYAAKGYAIEHVHSTSDAIHHMVGGPHDTDGPSMDAFHWLLILLGMAIVLLVCYSVVRTKFGFARRLTLLRGFTLDDVSNSLAIQPLQLVKRSERDVKDMLKHLESSCKVRLLRWDGSTIFWDDHIGHGGVAASSQAKSVFVVEDLRSASAGKRGAKLAKELTDLVRNESVILCSDIVPLYHLGLDALKPDEGAAQQRRRLEHQRKQHLWADDWSELLRQFDVGVLNCKPDLSKQMEEDRSREWAGVRDLLAQETHAHADFDCALRRFLPPSSDDGKRSKFMRKVYEFVLKRRIHKFRVIRKMREVVCKMRERQRSSQLREEALCNFHAVLQSRFQILWAVSSLDERAQLYALAYGGSPNMRQPAAISSLVNRGLITEEEPISLRSEAFGQFIDHHLDDSLDEWRRQGRGDWWRISWLPLVLLAGFGLLFFINSNPEAVGVIAAVGAAFIGLVPVITSLFRAGQFGQLPDSSSNE